MWGLPNKIPTRLPMGLDRAKDSRWANPVGCGTWRPDGWAFCRMWLPKGKGRFMDEGEAFDGYPAVYLWGVAWATAGACAGVGISGVAACTGI